MLVGWSFGAAAVAESASRSSYELYVDGEGGEALIQAKAESKAVMQTGSPRDRWSHLVFVAWLAESMGSHGEAMRYSRTALEIAIDLDESFEIGRSLCWLGWSATSLGMYPAAIEFYDAAIAVAMDPQGRAREPMVWGLATQEKGSVLA